MVFPFFSGKKNNPSEYFYGLFLKEKEGVLFIFQRKHEKISIIEQEKFAYSNSWENLLNDVDDCMSKFEANTKLSINKTIFFIYSHLIDEKSHEIKKPYLQHIKELVKNLELEPMGYIGCFDAVVEYLKKKEGATLNAVIIELDATNLGVYISKGGSRIFFESVARTDRLIDDLSVIFEKIKGDIMLPSRIILYNSSDLEHEVGEILSHRWDQDLFIQLPRVETIKEEDVYEALIHIFEEQMRTQVESAEMVEAREEEQTEEKEKKEVMGFVIGEDIQKKEEKKQERKSFAFPIHYIRAFFSRLKHLKLIPPMDKAPLKAKSSWIIGAILIVSAFFLLEYFFHKANVLVFLPAKIIEKEIQNASNIPSESADLVQVFEATYSAEFRQSIPTSGKREIGEKARGEATINNFDSREKVFAKGTKFSVDGVQFILDQEVKVSSPSVVLQGADFIKKPSTAKASLIAVDIGPKGNIEKGKQLSVEDFSPLTYFAIANSAFSGGSKKEIRTVSKKDETDLQSSLLEKAKEEGQRKINSILQSDDMLLNDLTVIKPEKLQFSSEIGEEANDLELKTNMNIIYYSLKNDQVKTFLKSAIIHDVDVGYDIQDITYTIKKIERKKNVIDKVFLVKAKQMKSVKKDALVKNMAGKSRDDVETMLKKNYEATGFEMKVDSPLPFLNNRLPFFQKNITVKISSL